MMPKSILVLLVLTTLLVANTDALWRRRRVVVNCHQNNGKRALENLTEEDRTAAMLVMCADLGDNPTANEIFNLATEAISHGGESADFDALIALCAEHAAAAGK